MGFKRAGHRSHVSGYGRFIKSKRLRKAFEEYRERQIDKLNEEIRNEDK